MKTEVKIICPVCGSLKAKKIRRMVRTKDKKEGMQFRCADCNRYYVVYQ